MNKKEIFLKRELNNRVNDGSISNYSVEILPFQTNVIIEVNGRNYKLHSEEVEYLYEQGVEDLKNELNDDFDLRGDCTEVILNKIFG